MSNPQTEMRRRTLAWLTGALAAVLALFAINNWPRGTGSSGDGRIGDPVVPGIADNLAEVTTITVSLADSGYTMIRDGEDWVMLEAGRYPVRLDRLRELEQGIGALVWRAAKTEDPDKYERIGVGHPATGGNGALVELLGRNKEVFASLIIGRRDERLYVREPDAATAWQVDGDVPPLLTREAWLDLAVVSMEAETIASVRLIAPDGDSLRLVRAGSTAGNQFMLAEPSGGRRLVTSFAALGPALALTRLSPLEAKPAAALETDPVMRHITVTRDGLEVIVDAYRDTDGGFITIRAIEAGQAETRAQDINTRAAGWAYRLTDYDWNDFGTPIGDLVTAGSDN